MILERRLIQDVVPGSTSHELLQAGRDALPPPGSKQRLLDAVLQSAAVSGGDTVLYMAPLGKAISASWMMARVTKLTALGVLAAAITWTFYASRQRDRALLVSSQANSASTEVSETAREQAVLTVDSQANSASTEVSETARGQAVSTVDSPVPELSVRLRPPRAPIARQAFTRGERDGRTTQSGRSEMATRDGPVIVSTQRSLEDTLLGEEVRRLDAVRSAMRARNPAVARRLLTDYSRHFPDGYLAPEARQLQAQSVEFSPDR